MTKKSTKAPAAKAKKSSPSIDPSTRDSSGIAEGMKVPRFDLEDASGKRTTSDLLKGKRYVLYFYPKDDTPGCTVEACGLRDHWDTIQTLGVNIFGVSPDSAASHRKFINKFSLPFALLADQDKELSMALGVWVEKSMYGKKYMGVERTTFVINASGIIEKIFRKVKPETHPDELLEYLQSNQ